MKEERQVTGKEFKSKSKRRPTRKHVDGDSFTKMVDEKRPYIGPNDINWRAEDDVLTRSAATLPFGYPLGLPIEVGASGSNPMYVPGIMAIRAQVSLGSASDYNSPINLADRMVYQINRRYNSGSRNYDSSNMGMIFAAVEQAIALTGWYQRIYWSINDFSRLSRYKPRVLLATQGVDYTDVSQHQAELAYLISWMGNAIKSIALPNLPIFEAAYKAFSGYYIDDDAGKHQLYFLVPDSFGVYSPGDDAVYWDSNDGGFEIPLPTQTLLTYSQLYAQAHALIDVLLSDQDVGLIVGDTAKAWGENLFKMDALTVEDCTKPVHSLEFLQQVHNLQVSPTSLSNYGENAGSTSTGPFLVAGYRIVGSYAATLPMVVNRMRIDAYSNEPESKEIINATVLQCNFHGWTQAGSSLTLGDLLSTGIVHDMFIPTGIILSVDADPVSPSFRTFVGLGASVYAQAYNTSYFPSTQNNFVQDILPMTNFDWHPLGYIGTTTLRYTFGDVRNLGYFETVVAKNIHENSMLNLLGFNKYGVTHDSSKK